MKKLVSLILALVLALFCTNAFAYTEGSYTASAAGNNGDVSVTVTFSADAILSVVVGDNQETEAIAAVPFERIPAAIVEGQTLAVDAVSGATNTSNALINAVAACVELAGGDVETLKSAAAPETAREVAELDTELVIVGGGTSGLSAAISAANAGVKTLLLEKNAFFGGAGAMSGGAVLVTGSEIQKEQGVTDDTPELMIEDFCKNGDDMNNMLMLDMYAQNIAEMVNWLMNDVGVTFQDGLIFQAEYQKDRVLYPVGAAKGLTQCLIDSMEAGDAEYMLDTRATELITQDGKVCGVKAQGIDKDYIINADAVLMASGGYGYAKDLLPESLQSVLYYGPTFATGDGQKMVMAVDAKFDLFDLGKIYPNGVEVAAGTAKSTIWPNAAAFSASGILVNLDGQRIVNEKASNNDLKQVLMEQPGQIMYLFMDAESFDAFCSRAGENGISDEEIAAWLENNGSCAPIFAHGGTIDEVCAIVGMNAEGLAATVARYNGFVEAGNDEDFGRPAAFLAKGIGEGPYYIVEQKPRFATTMGGVVLTGNMEVVNSQDQVIPGLYACGEMANLVHGSNSPVGANVSWALTSGYLAGEAVAKALNK